MAEGKRSFKMGISIMDNTKLENLMDMESILGRTVTLMWGISPKDRDRARASCERRMGRCMMGNLRKI